jgi:hypothetical protein
MARVALITGASRGIGAATALVLAEQGYRVVVNHRASAPQAEEVMATIKAAGGEAVAIKADVTAPDDVTAMVAEIDRRWGGTDVLVQMDLRRLRDGSIDAAYVGSTVSPEQVAGEEGFSVLCWVGDHFQIPTVGIAVDPARISLDNPALQALVRANQRALLTLAEHLQLAVAYIASFLDRLTLDEVQRYYERYIGPYFTSDGRVDLNVAQHAIDAVATELGVAAPSVDAMYQPAL